jgi:nucleoside-triphosphatase
LDPDTLAWGDEILAEVGRCDVLILDELGPVEFRRGEGLQKGMELVDRGAFEQAYVVLRPSLLGLGQARWPDANVLSLKRGPG